MASKLDRDTGKMNTEYTHNVFNWFQVSESADSRLECITADTVDTKREVEKSGVTIVARHTTYKHPPYSKPDPR